MVDLVRKHLSGRTINAHLDEITTYILIVEDTEEAVLETKRLEGQFIAYYGYPEWNKQLNLMFLLKNLSFYRLRMLR